MVCFDATIGGRFQAPAELDEGPDIDKERSNFTISPVQSTMQKRKSRSKEKKQTNKTYHAD